MPYVDQMDRQRMSAAFEQTVASISVDPKQAAGQCTYFITRLIATFFTGRYWNRALGFGILVCCILEPYRRRDSVEEDRAIKKNGDLPEFEEYAI